MSSKSNSTRVRILKATVALLETDGASSVRMSDIAKAAKISRQALYLHFPNRAELLVAAVRHVDEIHDVDSRLAPSRSSASGEERLAAWVAAWGGYIPQIHSLAKGLLAMCDTDAEARNAWEDRKQAVRHGCAAAVSALAHDGRLAPHLTEAEATDLLGAILSLQNWEDLRIDCDWSEKRYIELMQKTAARALLT